MDSDAYYWLGLVQFPMHRWARLNRSISGSPKVRDKKEKGARRLPSLEFRAYFFSQPSTSSAPCLVFHSFSSLWLPPLVSMRSPVSGCS